ncbi:hypothetical protein FYJ85_05025 [Victivallaceae bacterium BBE-744-WT-12]|uniref:CBM-cenC domain-containing protein n=1 Tax=Victivallis lenta TaxID=2606640 RepID=A0A844G1F9_9BACT|nr:hypothetical protein [Victivallis lenta]MST96408.1 hypothetical protein [Victivallis lenta]
MLKTRIVSALCVSLLLAASGAEIDLSGYLPPAAGDRGGSLVRNAGFEQGAAGWENIDGTECSTGSYGINQTGGLHYRRPAPGGYRQVSQQIRIVPGRRYRFGAMVRTRGVTGEGAGICIEGYDDKYAGGGYVHNRTGDTDWQLLTGEFTAKPDRTDANYKITLYLRKNATGEAWFDDVFVNEIAPRLRADTSYPTHHTLNPGGDVELFTLYEGEDGDGHFQLVEVEQNGGKLGQWKFPANLRNLKFRPDKLENGSFTIICRRIDPAGKRILAEAQIPMTFSPAPALPANAATIDADRRLIVGGKPYMPLGLYTQQVTRRDLELIAASPFNCIMPYKSPVLKLEDSKLTGDDAVAEALDLCDKLGIKVLFSLKDLFNEGDDAVVTRLVERFRNHPALLSWYICDEAAVDRIPEVAARRRLVNRLDPFHPTWSVFYQWPDFHHYVPCQDVFGNDPYPINFRDDSHIEGTDASTRAAEALNMPLWSVPQIHHTGFYNFGGTKWQENPVPYFSTQRAPNEEEMNTICLLEAMRGAKGFVMYSYFDLHWGPDKLQFERRWPIVCRVAERLKKLEPYLLSAEAAPEVKTEAVKGKIYARAFRAADGSTRVLVCQVSSGEGEAKLTVGDGETGYLSENGRTVEVSPGVYRFFGKNTTFDILRKE